MKAVEDLVSLPNDQNSSSCKALDPTPHHTSLRVWFSDSFPLHANTALSNLFFKVHV
ncbi:hypothetical protein Hanom_Chr06g00547941 [Helianthus anomalus]